MPLFGLALLLVLAVGAASWAVAFVRDDRERDLRAWQTRLNIVADSRFAAVDEWLRDQTGAARELAQNTSLQLYMTELALAAGDASQVTDESAQRGYLRQLLLAAAARDGFLAPAPESGIAANVSRTATAGLALTDPQGRALVATPDMPPIDERLASAIKAATSGPAIVDLYLGAAGTPTMAFIAPIYALQADSEGSAPIGAVIGVKEVASELYPRLRQPGATEETAEAILVRRDGGQITYLTPLKDSTQPLRKTLAVDTPDLAESWATDEPGGFARKRDYADRPVLAVARQFSSVPWTLVYKIDAGEALAVSDARRRDLLIVLLLAIGGLGAVIVAAWRHGTSRREAQAASRARALAGRLDDQRAFLKLVTDSQPAAISILDENLVFRWVNATACRTSGLPEDQIVGKPVASVIGPVPARDYEIEIRKVLANSRADETTQVLDRGGVNVTLRNKFLPLQSQSGEGRRVLVVSEDVTPLVEARAKRERLMRQVVTMLVRVIDRRDPYSADHSARVAEVAAAVAAEMGLDAVMRETAAIAGQLMNLGKIAVPEAILTRSGKLSEAELRQIRESLLTSADLVKDVEFDGPVSETLRELQERWDGTGVPEGLKGDTILLPARIISVANAFVGMVSARSWRRGMPLDKAVEQLLDDRGRVHDPKVVLALANYVQNRGGAEAWAHFNVASPSA